MQIAEELYQGHDDPLKKAEEMPLYEALLYLSYKKDQNEPERQPKGK